MQLHTINLRLFICAIVRVETFAAGLAEPALLFVYEIHSCCAMAFFSLQAHPSTFVSNANPFSIESGQPQFLGL